MFFFLVLICQWNMTLEMDLAPEDFRQMWQRPSYEELRSTLHSLELSPPVWKHDRQRSDILREQEYMQGHRKGEVTRYLSSIIKSPLLWLEDDEQREEIWSQASKRMSERCGRTAMGDVTRRWPFEGGENSPESWEVVIREPALTGDSLGFKTWGSSYVLARHLPQLAATSLAGVFRSSPADKPLAILELGSGTGLLGVAAAALWGTSVALSDLPNIVPNLMHNAELNRGVVEDRGGSLSVGALTWGGGDDEVDQELFAQHFQFNVCPLITCEQAPASILTRPLRLFWLPTLCMTTTTRLCLPPP